MLEVWGKNNGLVPSLTRQLDAEVPRVKSDKSKLEVFGGNVLGVEVVEAFDGITEGASVADLVPGKGCQAGCASKGAGLAEARRGEEGGRE